MTVIIIYIYIYIYIYNLGAARIKIDAHTHTRVSTLVCSPYADFCGADAAESQALHVVKSLSRHVPSNAMTEVWECALSFRCGYPLAVAVPILRVSVWK